MSNLHAYYTEDDSDRIERENASNANRKTQNNGHHTSPGSRLILANDNRSTEY